MNSPPPLSTSAPLADAQPPRRLIDSQQILCGAAMVEIDHAGQRYVLRVTRENKLILTK